MADPIRVPAQLPQRGKPLLAFVGEAPSNEELMRGEPLVGPAGRVFNQLMRTAGLDRYEHLITNVFDQKLPANDVKHWCIPLKEARASGLTDLPPIGDAGFLRAEHREHLDRLRGELEEWQPTVVVPLGGTALWALTGQTKIMSWRGQVTPAKYLVPGKKLLPTLHPQAVSYQWKLFTTVVGDLLRAQAEALRGPEVVYPNKRLIIEPTLEDLEAYTPTLLASDLMSVDIETGWGQIINIGFAPNAKEGINLPFWDLRTTTRSYWPTPEEEFQAWLWAKRIMESDVPKLGQNFGAYDFFWLLRKMNIAPRNFREDTRLLHHAKYPELPKDLSYLGATYATQGAWKHWGSRGDKRDDKGK